MEIKEGVKTCVLSRTWTELWKFTAGSLNFEAPEGLERLSEAGEARILSFVKWVNSVLKMHKSRRIDNSYHLTIEKVRRLTENDLKLGRYALDVHKKFMKGCFIEYTVDEYDSIYEEKFKSDFKEVVEVAVNYDVLQTMTCLTGSMELK